MTTPCIYIYRENIRETTTLSLLELLLDETLSYGTVCIPQEFLQAESGQNRRLPAKQVYELLLRLATHHSVVLTGEMPSDDEKEHYLFFNTTESTNVLSSLKTDCYLLSLYKKEFLSAGFFDAAAESILAAASKHNYKDEIIPFLEGMLAENDTFLFYELGSRPFLIYTGSDVCYHVLDVFARQFGAALQRLGYMVEYFDLSAHDFTESSRFIGRHYQAVIGFQTYMFSARLADGITFLHDTIVGPSYNFVFDHPILFQKHLTAAPKGLTILTPDRNYAAFAKKFFPVNAAFLPPGGIVSDTLESSERIYEISFIGTYYDLKEVVADSLRHTTRQNRFLINRFWHILRRNPHLTGECALERALQDYGITLSDEAFVRQFHEMRLYLLYLANHYRYKILKTLLDAGISVDVFGASWAQCDLNTHPHFIWHKENLTTNECLAVWKQSKIALNIMTWHKDAVTERILNSMLQGSAVLTERNPYLEEQFADGKEILFYDLSHLEQIPLTVQSALASPEHLADLAAAGLQKASASHTWDCRAKEFCQLLE